MALIYLGSTNVLSSQRTSRIIVPILRWFWPSVSQETLRQVQVVVRKMGHVTEYAILAALCWRALRPPARGEPRSWSFRDAAWAFTLATAYAATDEIHQTFVSTRYGSAWDVLIDAFGAFVGLGLVWWVGRWRRRW